MIGGMRLYRIAIACCTLALLAACGRSHVTREPAANASAGERPVRVSQPKYGATVVVQRGQNVYRIATENGLTALDLALWNDIPPPYTIHPGQRLRLYPGGQPVRAAADGVVVYSGSGLVGYGELVILKHSDQWLSAYGHNRARLVNEGQLVKAGQQIAEMGRSGASRDMLHFEIRYNGKPVDPQAYLPKK